MPINQLVDFAHSSKHKNDKCDGCTHTCTNKCNICLQEIHFDGNLRGYDCQNMIYCYTCSYIYKYASEIDYLFKLHKCESFSEFNILSLGCGSCADLFGINNFLAKNNRLNVPIKYVGVDSNEKWTDTQSKITEIFPLYSFSFINSDVFDYLDNISKNDFDAPNILILQYLLNELVKHAKAKLPKFVDDLVGVIVDKMPDNSLVLINDINHNTMARDWFSIISSKIRKTNLSVCFEYRFNEPTSHTYGGRKHENDQLLFTVPPVILQEYDVKQPCSSAQAVIYKTKSL
ncbi:hypothetical protein LJC06_02710 [Bacteroidales bacterium OttesenSCG-928-I14]|nr:hypothetical protein [Bacteroidales bacterium OttesenSCG-928-I14]